MWLIDWSWQRCFFLAKEVDPPLMKSSEMVLIVPRSGGSDGVTSVWAGYESWVGGWVGCRSLRESREGYL